MSRTLLCHLTALSLIAAFAGCNSRDDEFKPVAENQPAVEEEHHEHEEGPHGGHIIDLGDHDYRAEIVMAEDRALTIYLLQHDTDDPLAVDPAGASLALLVDEKPVTVELEPQPQESDPEGQSSVFVVAAENVPESITDEEALEGNLIVKVGDKQYTGAIEHHHEH